METPAQLVGDDLAAAWEESTYIAVYDVGNQTSAHLNLRGTAQHAELLYYDQEYFHAPGSEDGFFSVPNTERFNPVPLQANNVSIRIVQPLQNFSLVIRHHDVGTVTLHEGLAKAPLRDSLLLTPIGRGETHLQPAYDRYNWTPNFITLGLEGPHHHFETNHVSGDLVGNVDVWIGHAVIEIVADGKRSTVRLDTRVDYGATALDVGRNEYAHFNGSMLRGTFDAKLAFNLKAPYVRLLSPTPTFANVTTLSAPLVEGQLRSPVQNVTYRDRPHLDIVGDFSLALEPPVARPGTNDFEPVIRTALFGQVDGITVNRATTIPFDSYGTIAATAGLGALAVLFWFVRQHIVDLAARWFVPLYSLLRRDDLLDHPTRGAIHRAIHQNQGISFEGLRAALTSPDNKPMANGTLLYHLWRLRQKDLVRSSQAEGSRVYFTNKHENDEEQAQSVLLAGKAARTLARSVLKRPGLTHMELAASLGGPMSTARQRCRHHVQKLVQAELIVQTIDGRQRRYHPTERLRDLLRPDAVAPAPTAAVLESITAKPIA